MTGTEVVRISGAPGCGKTTRLMDLVADERDRGARLTDIYYVTFSKSAVEETRNELRRIFDPEDDDAVETAGRTFHSLALSLLRDDDVLEDLDEQIIERRSDAPLYEEFARRHGLEFDRHATDPTHPGNTDTNGVPSGNRFFDVYDQLQVRCLEPEDVTRVPIELPRSPERTAEIATAWEHRKRAGRPDVGLPLFEHNDYVREVVDREYAPAATALFIDEFQDLSPLEYRLYKMWRDSGRLDRIYIAGDPNQSIYGSFRAARPEFFAETPVDDEHRLRNSWRCPAAIVSAARQVLNDDPAGARTELTAREPGGSVDVRSIDSDPALAASIATAARRHRDTDGNTVFALARTNYQVQSIARALKAAGVPYERLGSRGSVWNETLGELLIALQALRDGHGVGAGPLETLLSKAPGRRRERIGGDDTPVNLRLLGEGQGLAPEAVWKAFPDVTKAADIVPMLDLTEYRQDALESALTGADDLAPGDVRIGTIHSAKGLEAPCVFLHAAAAPQVMERYNSGHTAEEHRLYYVGATRASEELAIVRGYFDDETFPVFERFREPDDPTEVVV